MRYENSLLLVCAYLFCLLGGSLSQTAGSNCRINDAKHTAGVCTYIKQCTSAIANLRAGISPTRCQGQNASIVCCPTGKRVSAKTIPLLVTEAYQPNDITNPATLTTSIHKTGQTNVNNYSTTECKAYTEVLKMIDGPFPLLPPVFLEDNVEEEIHCNPNHNPLISGGRESKAEEFPFAVALGYNTTDTPWRCGGTLISDEYVLTAAHCIDTRSGKPTKLLLGDIYLNTQTSSNTRTVRGVANIIKHPDYKPPMSYNDVALIKMDKKVEISRAILPACLPQPQDDLLKNFNNNLTLTAVGWGYLGPAEKQSEVLQAVILKGFGHRACDKYYAEIIERSIRLPKGIHNSQLCAGDNTTEKDTCQGDSGGGLVISDKDKRCIFYVAGITSFGPRFCGYRTPAVYTNVISYLEWIESVVWPNN